MIDAMEHVDAPAAEQNLSRRLQTVTAIRVNDPIVLTLDDPADLAQCVLRIANAGDLVVCLGAGTITNWANALPGELRAAQQKKAGAG